MYIRPLQFVSTACISQTLSTTCKSERCEERRAGFSEIKIDFECGFCLGFHIWWRTPPHLTAQATGTSISKHSCAVCVCCQITSHALLWECLFPHSILVSVGFPQKKPLPLLCILSLPGCLLSLCQGSTEALSAPGPFSSHFSHSETFQGAP